MTSMNFFSTDQQDLQEDKKVVIIWDLIKKRLRKSEEDEMARLIGLELVTQLEELRDELNALLVIQEDMEEDQEQIMTKKKDIGLFSENQNQDFLNKEIFFFIDDLERKAVDFGLKEDSLIPQKDSRDQQIYKFIKNTQDRPSSALSRSTKAGSSIKQQMSPRTMSMRSSFYSISNQDQEMTNSPQKQEPPCEIANKLQIKNILELSNQDKEIVSSIKNFMQKQVVGLQDEIERTQNEMLEDATAQATPEPTKKELKEYSVKLQEELLRSDTVIRIQKLPTPSKQSIHQRKNSLSQVSKMGGASQQTAQGTPVNNASIKLMPLSSQMSQSKNSGAQPPINLSSTNSFKKTLTKGFGNNTGISTSAIKLDHSLLSQSATGPDMPAPQKSVVNFKRLSKAPKKDLNTTDSTPNSMLGRSGSKTGLTIKRPSSKQGTQISESQSTDQSNQVPAQRQKIRIMRRDSKSKLPIPQQTNKTEQDQPTNNNLDLVQVDQKVVTKLKQKVSLRKMQQPMVNLNSTQMQELPRKKEPVQEKDQMNDSLYGLDLSILESLNLGELIEEKKREDQIRQSMMVQEEEDPDANLDFEQLRKEHIIEPPRTKVNRLRGLCREYTDVDNSNQNTQQQDDDDSVQIDTNDKGYEN